MIPNPTRAVAHGTRLAHLARPDVADTELRCLIVGGQRAHWAGMGSRTDTAVVQPGPQLAGVPIKPGAVGAALEHVRGAT